MKKLLLLFCLWLSSLSIISQNIVWEKTFRKARFNDFKCIRSTPDGGCILGATIIPYYNFVNDSDVLKEKNDDIWLVKQNTRGETEWEKILGDSAFDDLIDIQTTTDGGYVILSLKMVEDKTVNRDSIYLESNWKDSICISKTNSMGNIEWEKTYSRLWEDIKTIQQTNDGGYLIGGYTLVYDKNTAPKTFKSIDDRNHFIDSKTDAVVYKFDSKGDIQWRKTYGGSKADYLQCIRQVPDGGCILGGFSSSSDGDIKHGNKVKHDAWVIKINSKGRIQWEKTYGGSGGGRVRDIQLTPDGGYILGCYGTSNSLQEKVKSESNKYNDYWVVKIDSKGKIQWEKIYGGTRGDALESIIPIPDGSYVLGGQTNSSNGDVKSGNKGDWDYWLVKITPQGDILWEKTFGGSKSENLKCAQLATDGGYLLGGSTESSDGDIKSKINGGRNIWIVKVNE